MATYRPKCIYTIKNKSPGTVVHTFNASTSETETDRFLWISGELGLHNDILPRKKAILKNLKTKRMTPRPMFGGPLVPAKLHLLKGSRPSQIEPSAGN